MGELIGGIMLVALFVAVMAWATSSFREAMQITACVLGVTIWIYIASWLISG